MGKLKFMTMNTWNLLAFFLLPVNSVTGRHGVMTEFAARGHQVLKNEQLKMILYDCLLQCEHNPSCKMAEITTDNICIHSPQDSIIKDDQRKNVFIKGINIYSCMLPFISCCNYHIKFPK